MSASVPILLYHSVSDDPPDAFSPYAVSRRQFSAHLDRLTTLGFTTLTVGQLLAARATGMLLPERTAVVTFDDGFADFAAYAWPELAARDLAATLYVTAGTLDGTSRWLAPLGGGQLPMLTRRQVVALAGEGCEIGAHSMTHPQLDCIPRAAAAREIRQSKAVLEDVLGRPVDSFAYPHGYHDRTVRQLVIDAGFTSAAAVKNALSATDDDVFALARVTVTADFDLDRLTDTLAGLGVPVGRRGERLRTRLWRQARRIQHRRTTDSTVAA
jgi:peptidoglycan/xylan/chitin deacetylase (PgdA/CDA1 family)